jgi:VanZ family protein
VTETDPVTPVRPAPRCPFFLLLAGTLAMLAAILFFGLRFEGFAFTNHVQWSTRGNGLRFGPNGMAYAEIALPACGEEGCAFTLEAALRPDGSEDARFRIIVLIHDGDDEDQFLLGQWRSSLVVMNGDDYDGRRGLPRTGIRNAFSSGRPLLVAVTSGPSGTALFVDGRRVRHHDGFRLSLPGDGASVRLIVGNSGYVRHPWTGEVQGLAVYDRPLDPERLAAHFTSWSREKAFSSFLADDPAALYGFGENGGTKTRDLAGKNPPLAVPPELKPFQRDILAVPRPMGLQRSYVTDLVVNLFGFVPFGLVLGALLTHSGRRSRRLGFLLTVLTCFVTSLAIEIVQAWIPSRSSELSDLLLNAAGGALGFLLLLAFERHRMRAAAR